MRAVVLLLIGASGLLPAQVSVDPQKYPAVRRAFEQDPGETPFTCEFRPARPVLTFAFQFQAGWTFEVPFRKIRNGKHRIVILARVVPEMAGNLPFYLYEEAETPDHPSGAKDSIELDGAFLHGPGEYTVDAVAYDDATTTCRATWRVQAVLKKSDQELFPNLDPGVLHAIEPGVWSHFASSGHHGKRSGRLTILLNAASFRRRATRVGWEAGLLLSGVAALLRFTDFESVRLVAYNLDQQKVIFESDDFGPASIGALGRAIRELDLATVPVGVLNRPGGHVVLLADLLQTERNRPVPSDTVIFFGPTVPFDQKWTAPRVLESRLVYLNFRPMWGWIAGPYSSGGGAMMSLRSGEFPDLIERITKANGGKVFRIHSPREFAGALRHVAAPVRPGA